MISVISVFLSFCNFIKKKSTVIFYITMFFLWTLMAFTYGDADETVYISRYSNLHLWEGQTELLYGLILKIFSKLGCSFYQYKAIITAIELLLIGSTIRKMAKYPNFVLVCYFVVPFALNVTQMRNALAAAIFIWFSRFLFEDSNKKRLKLVGKYIEIDITDLLYIIGVLLATMIHTASLIWLVLLVAKKCDISVCVLFTAIVNVVVGFIITPHNIAKILSVVSKGAASRMISYLTSEYQQSEWRHYSQILYVFIVAVILFLVYFLIINKKRLYDYNSDLKTMLKMNICILVILALMFRYTQEVYRLQEGLFVLNYIMISNAIPDKDMNTIKISTGSFFVHLLLWTYIIFSAWFLMYHYLIPTVIYPVFNNNYFWNIFF